MSDFTLLLAINVVGAIFIGVVVYVGLTVGLYAAIFFVVVVAFAVALFARWRMMHEDPRPGYVHEDHRHKPTGHQ